MRLWFLFATSVALLLSGCAAPRPIMPAPYTVVITADRALNPNRSGQPAPVQVKLFKLRNANTFLSTDFFTLYEKADEALRMDLISADAFTLQPGEVKRISGIAGDDERMVGIFVAYRDLENAMWRAVAPLPQPRQAPRDESAETTPPPAQVKATVGPNKVTISSHSPDPGGASTGSPATSTRSSQPTRPKVPWEPSPNGLPSLSPVQRPPPLPSKPTLVVPGASSVQQDEPY